MLVMRSMIGAEAGAGERPRVMRLCRQIRGTVSSCYIGIRVIRGNL